MLSLVMGLGMMLKPLRSFNIDPMKVPTLIAYTMPITITMVMPIAALLATTLTYGRLAFDNEINACRSSGISVISLIYPAGTLALLIGLASLLLGFHTIPYFISKFENILSEDAEAMIFRGIEKKGELSSMFSGLVIHADQVWAKEHILQGVTLVTTDRTKVKEVITAKAVKLNIEKHPDTGENRMRLQLGEACGLIDDAYVEIGRNEFTVPIPTLFKDKIKFKNLDELKAIGSNLGSFAPIRLAFEKAVDQYIQEVLFHYTDQELKHTGYALLNCDNGRTIRIFASGCDFLDKNKSIRKKASSLAELLPLDDGTIIVEYTDPDNPALRKEYTCDEARLQYMYYNSSPRVVLSMKNASWQTASGNVINYINEALTGIIVPDKILHQADGLSIKEFAAAEEVEDVVPSYSSERLIYMAQKLKNACRSLQIEIAAEKHSRLAFGVSCVILTVMGAGLGIIFKSGHLLMAFGISFIPAVFCLVTMFTGKHIAESSTDMTVGLIFMWSGVVLVAALDVLMYRKLSKT